MNFNLQMFADAGTLVNATGNYINAGTGAVTNFDSANTLAPTIKGFYDTQLLENAREQLVYAQLGRPQTLPAGHGKTVEWRKWNTLPDAPQLTEGVIPTGQKFGQSAYNVAITQHGEYISISDQLELHAVDNVIMGAAEELGAACGKTLDKLVRNVLAGGTNVIFAPRQDGTQPATRQEVDATCKFSADLVARAVTKLKKANAKTFEGGCYVAVVHPSVAYDLRKDKDWISAHQYAAPDKIFSGEIGELHGVRFVETTLAPVVKEGDTALYLTMFFGKNAFGVVDPEGAGLETIIKDKSQVGGPLNQFSTVGCKFSMGAKILYPEAMVTVESASSYSDTDEAN